MICGFFILICIGLMYIGGLFILQKLEESGIDGANNPWIVLLFAIIGMQFFALVL